ncbi:hypothetical protein MHYP_G00084230 [Metynnis hypsauchen]
MDQQMSQASKDISFGCPRLVITDFGSCLAEEALGLKLPFTSRWVNRGGNACLMAPERPSARVAANILHLSLWGKQALTSLNPASMGKMADWLLCQSAMVLLKGCGPRGSSVEAKLQRGFRSNLDLEELRMAVGYLMYGRELWQSADV